ERLGYESSLVARSLRSRRTNVLGILVAEFEPFSTEILKGASRAVAGTGFDLLAYSGAAHGGGDVGWERRSLSRLSGTLIDGAVLVTPTVVEVRDDVPVVAIDPHRGPSGIATVDADNDAGAVLATAHLIALGHRRIGFLGGRPDLESSRQREEGFRSAMAAAGLPVDPALVRVGGYKREGADRPAHELLARPDRPTAVFAANDLMALATIDAARDVGLRVPQDLSVGGFDDGPEAVAATPPLTTVAQPIRQMGAAARGTSCPAGAAPAASRRPPRRPLAHSRLPSGSHGGGRGRSARSSSSWPGGRPPPRTCACPPASSSAAAPPHPPTAEPPTDSPPPPHTSLPPASPDHTHPPHPPRPPDPPQTPTLNDPAPPTPAAPPRTATAPAQPAPRGP